MPTWFITGCSTGLGRALAAAVLDRGDNAVVTARDVATARDLAGAYPDTALALSLDVTDAAQGAAAVRAAHERFDGIDVLVNNAGYGYRAAAEEGADAAPARSSTSPRSGRAGRRRARATTRRPRQPSRPCPGHCARSSRRLASPSWQWSPARSAPTSPAGRWPSRAP